LLKHPVAVEKGTRAVISMNFSLCVGRTFNNLQANFSQRNHQKEFFNSQSLIALIEGF
jgi:hypothetical protein